MAEAMAMDDSESLVSLQNVLMLKCIYSIRIIQLDIYSSQSLRGLMAKASAS